jgi:hypothetical protein
VGLDAEFLLGDADVGFGRSPAWLRDRRVSATQLAQKIIEH